MDELTKVRRDLDISRNAVDELIHRLRNRDRKIEGLTAERDAALRRVEELEAELVDWHGTRGLDMENPNDSTVIPH